MIRDVDSALITLTDPEIIAAHNLTVKYLLALEPERFLVEFNKVAGIKTNNVQGYQGWERPTGNNFRGHFFGHYLSALSQALHTEGNLDTQAAIHAKLTTAVTGLLKAQTEYAKAHPESAGYVSAFREVALDAVEGKPVPENQKENVLVPWYDLHKILAGLIAVAVNVASIDAQLADQAREVAEKFGEYVYRRMIKLTDPTQMLKTEYGGMNDGLYALFALTQNPHDLKAATYFDETALFDELDHRRDVLAGKHANTTIPKVIGALRRYEVFQEPKLADQFLTADEAKQLPHYLTAAENFWQMVIDDHTYVTGGNSQSEHFHEPGQLFEDAALKDGATTCETCNTYNVLKLSRELFKVTGQKKYLDYYERTYCNAILGSQNPETGMMTYFQPMGAGYTKIFNRPFDEFWCCTGTGIENFTKLGDSDYFMDDRYLTVNLYFSNQLRLVTHNLTMTVDVDRRRGDVAITIEAIDSSKPTVSISLALRRPEWVKGNAALVLNDHPVEINQTVDFWHVESLSAGAKLNMHLPMALSILVTEDNPHYLAFSYGPYVLAGQLDNYELTADRPNGVLVRISTHNDAATSTLTTHQTWSAWRKNFAQQAVVKVGEGRELVSVKLPNVDEQIQFIPYYQTYQHRYGIYFQWQQAGSQEAQQRADQLKRLANYRQHTIGELTNFDANNFEINQHLKQADSEVGNLRGRRFRQAHPTGWFSYQFPVTKPLIDLRLSLTFNVADAGKQLQVTMKEFNLDQTILVERNDQADQDGFYQITIPISVTDDQQQSINIKFSAIDQLSARLFGIRLFND